MNTIRIDLTVAQLRAVLGIVGPAVSQLTTEDHPLYSAERELDGALLAHEQAGRSTP